MSKEYKKVCDRCGAIYETNRKTQRFCSTGCHSKFYGEQRKKNKTTPVCKKCGYCGEIFQPVKVDKRTKFCSLKCALKACDKRKKVKQTKKECKICGNKFMSKRKTQKFCYNCGKYKSKGKNRVSPELRAEVLKLQNYKCWFCKGKLSFENAKAHHLDGEGQKLKDVDNSIENLCALHDNCHKLFHYIFLIQKNGEWFIRGDIFMKMKDLKYLKIYREEE